MVNNNHNLNAQNFNNILNGQNVNLFNVPNNMHQIPDPNPSQTFIIFLNFVVGKEDTKILVEDKLFWLWKG